MRVECESCTRSLDFSGERPSFCAYCGTPIPKSPLSGTRTYHPAPIRENEIPTQISGTNHNLTYQGDEQDPTQLGDYQIIRRLGSGGMGTVFLAEDKTNGRNVAIKVINPRIAASPDNLERFRQEGRLASLITHPRCVFVYQADEDRGRPYIVMELMPGATLKDIVTQQGPLPAGQAINKILDVIEGLQAAHQMGVIHRDVKPSNCFVMPDGRVKVGDFGLSKFLPAELGQVQSVTPTPQRLTRAENDERALTRTGVFVGTPLFASPEQIKGEDVDYRSDLYSVAATLYFLLTGKAPFEGIDNTATIARIVSDDPESVCRSRPEISPELDRVIMRALDRKCELRYTSLAEFKQALLPFRPGYLQNAPRLDRVRAAIVDTATLAPLILLIYQLMPYLLAHEELVDITADVVMWLVILAYFLITEVMAGASFGKWLLRLRVGGSRPGKPPKRRQLLLRAVGFFIIVALPGLVGFMLTGYHWVKWLLHGAGLLLLFDSMRARGGYRGLHEVLSGTCVVQVPISHRTLTIPIIPPKEAAPLPSGMPKQIGMYSVHGIHRVLDDKIFLEGMDLVLDRPVWLVMRPLEEGKIAPARREISRGSRLRWLGGGDAALDPRSEKLSHHWDAFIAPTSGCSLTRLVSLKGRLTWADAREILLQLAKELSTSLQDGTFPDELGPEQVWLQPDGRLVVIGARFDSQDNQGALYQQATSDVSRSFLFLQQTAALLLEGKPRRPDDHRPIQAPIPTHERLTMDRLMSEGEPFKSPEKFVEALQSSAEQPKEVTPLMRLGQLLLLSALLSPILLAVLIIGRFYQDIQPTLRITHQIWRAERMIEWLGDANNRQTFKQFIQQNPQELRNIHRSSLVELLSSNSVQLLPADTNLQLFMAACRGQIKVKLQSDIRAKMDQLDKQLSFAALAPYFLLVEFLPDRRDATRPQQTLTARHNESNERLFEDLRNTLRHSFDQKKSAEEPLPLLVNRSPLQLAALIIGTWFIVWILWSMIMRGGLSLSLMGIELLQANGKKAGPFRIGLRSVAVWGPFFALLLFSIYLQETGRWGQVGMPWTFWWLAVIYLAVCAVTVLIWPRRGLHDRLTGIYLLPR